MSTKARTVRGLLFLVWFLVFVVLMIAGRKGLAAASVALVYAFTCLVRVTLGIGRPPADPGSGCLLVLVALPVSLCAAVAAVGGTATVLAGNDAGLMLLTSSLCFGMALTPECAFGPITEPYYMKSIVKSDKGDLPKDGEEWGPEWQFRTPFVRVSCLLVGLVGGVIAAWGFFVLRGVE